MTATTTERALLRAILEDPADDLPRLAYADWREETGDDDRAEFIRVQIELSKLPPKPILFDNCHQFVVFRGEGSVVVRGKASVGDRIDLDLGDRKDECPPGVKRKWHGLLVTGGSYHEASNNTSVEFVIDNGSRPWAGEALAFRERHLWGYLPATDGVLQTFAKALPGWAVLLDSDPGDGLTRDYPWAHVRRGFVAAISLTLADFERHAAAIFSAHPVEEVALTDRRPHWDGSGYCWYDQDRNNPQGVPSRANLTMSLLKIVASAADQEPIRWVRFNSVADALAALSRACVEYGRSLVKPKLPTLRPKGR